jgi:hypothetical protein
MPPRRPQDVRRWLQKGPSLAELRKAYPGEWEVVQRDLTDVVRRGDVDELKAYARAQATTASTTPGARQPNQSASLADDIRRHMAAAALEQLAVSAATGIHEGRLRFNLINGYVAQKLLFKRDLERRPVSMFWFRLVWPLLWQRRFLMPLVGPKGIYCFYSRRLVHALAATIGERSCLEIAAGDGTLSRFLANAGVNVTATDDHSWRDVRFADTVLRQDARTALAAHRPEVVICSWPPAGNSFERQVFKTSSVGLYIVIASRHKFASADWDAYERQTDFAYSEDATLSRLVLPPELEAAVYVFHRRSPAASPTAAASEGEPHAPR